tara:strand:+ start:2116 stop:2523 length:408 start_codon:yes stop_codon:yes gene_type:complete
MIKKILFYNIILSCLIICQANTYNNIFFNINSKNNHINTKDYKININKKNDINYNNKYMCLKNESSKYNILNSYIKDSFKKSKYYIDSYDYEYEYENDDYGIPLKDLIKLEYKNFKKSYTIKFNKNFKHNNNYEL